MARIVVFRQFFEEVKEGPFSILSDAALDRIITMIRVAMDAGYNDGLEDGKRARAKE